MRLRRAFGHIALALPALAALAGRADAHASERMVILTLPTGHYIAGAAAAVAITALAAVFARRLPGFPAFVLSDRPARPAPAVVSLLPALVLAGLVAAGYWGSRDPMANPLPLMLWTVVWVGLTLASVIFGNIWRTLSPWRGPVRLIRQSLGLSGRIGLARLGYWPAVLGFLGFAWLEMVSLRPDDPAVLARVVGVYWLSILALAVAEGEDWLDRGEALTVYFGFVSRIAPLWREEADGRVRRMAGPPGAQILRLPPLPPSAIAFVTLILAGVTFDGLHETFWWLVQIGINPLEFPGRSAVTGVNSAGLLATWALTTATILSAIWSGLALAAEAGRFRALAGPLMLSFLPIASGYHVAHYLIALMTQGQYVIAALNDPFHREWAILGLSDHWVSFGFLSDMHWVQAIWNVQFAVILTAHLLAVILSLKLTARADGGDARPLPAVAHLPVTVLMVLYTALGLWLLSTPTGA